MRPAPANSRPQHARVVAAAAVLGSLALLVAGCDAASKSAATSGSGTGVDSAPYAGGDRAAAPMESAPAAMPTTAAGGVSAKGGSGTPLLPGHDVIYTADITVRVADIGKAVDAVEQLATTNEGVVYAEKVDLAAKSDGDNGTASATVTLKVPPSSLSTTLDAVGALGTEVGRSENSDDVTSTFVDVNARIAAAQASVTRLTDLLNHSGNVSDLLNVENQLAQRDADLESLEQQQKSLQAQIAQATITAHLLATPPIVKPAAKQAHTVGFVRGLRGGWHGFTTTVAALATALGAVLPFVIVLAVLLLAWLLGRRHLRARREHRSSPQES